MKNLFILLFCAFSIIASAQGTDKSTVKPIFYSITTADTIHIDRLDNIASIVIVVPDGADDSTLLGGGTGILDGHQSGFIKIPPGEYYPVLGYNDLLRLDSLTIIVRDKADLITIPLKKH